MGRHPLRHFATALLLVISALLCGRSSAADADIAIERESLPGGPVIEVESMQEPKHAEGRIEAGAVLFADRGYRLGELPQPLRGLRFLRASIDGCRIRIATAGRLLVITGDSPHPSARGGELERAGFARVPGVPSFQLFGTSPIAKAAVYEKRVQAGERLALRELGIVAGFADLRAAQTQPKPWTENAGELLYNGIRLPEIWPPEHLDPRGEEPMPVPYLDHPPKVIPIDVGRQLFVDDFLIEQTDLQRTFHQPRKHEGNPVFKPQTEPEMKAAEWVLTGNGGLFYDPQDKLFKLFYTAGWRGGLALATSTDLIHWKRPDLGLPAGGNLILAAGLKWNGKAALETAGSDNCVWLDLNADHAHERLKYLTCWMHVADNQERPPGFHHTFQTSADGRAWSPELRTTTAAHDYSTFFHNHFRDVWVASIRYNNDSPRARRRKYFESREFAGLADWNQAVYWTGADRLDLPEPAGAYPGAGDPAQLYGLNGVAYESLMIGMHYIHRGPGNEIAGKERVPKLIDLELGFSRDGFHWHRPHRRGFIQGSRQEGSWDRGYLLGAAGVFVIHDEQLVFPYTGCAGVTSTGDRGIYKGGSIGIATLRRDGFASMDAVRPGTLTTRLLTFSGSHLFVNTATAPDALRVELLDEHGKVLATSQPTGGDQTRLHVRWQERDDLAAFAGKPVRFRFTLNQGGLYAFWVTPAPQGSSGGYLAAGGPDYAGIKDTARKPQP